LIAGGTTVLRDVFDFIHPAGNLASVLSDPGNKNIIESKITTSQRQLLGYYSPGTCVNSGTFDISLLSLLLQNICGLSPPAKGWHEMPPANNTSWSADIIRIRLLRNEVYAHTSSEMAISDSEFIDLWVKISDVLVRMEGIISKAKAEEWRTTINTFTTEPLTEEAKRNAEQLQEWYRQDTEVKEKLMQMEKGIDELKTSIGQYMAVNGQRSSH
jgi:hypothetical protein